MTDPIVPKFANGDIPLPQGMEEFLEHLDQMEADSLLPPDAILFDKIETQLTATNSISLLPTLLPKLTALLNDTVQDPTPLTSFLTRLLRPVPFRTILGLAPPSSLARVLSAASPAANLLGLALVAKAAADRQSAAILAGDDMGDVVDALLGKWMSAEGVEVGNGAGKVVLSVLEVDCPTVHRVKWGDPVEGAARNSLPPLVAYDAEQPGTNVVWNLFFSPSCLRLLIEPCVAPTPHPRQTTIAQDRLLRIVPELAALSLPHLARTDAESGTSVLAVVANMVDVSDILMVQCLADFCENLICLLRLSPWAGDAEAMGEARKVVRDCMERVPEVREAAHKLPDRVPPEEQEAVKAWVETFRPE